MAKLVPLGYMAKAISKRPEFLKASQVEDIYSVSDCVSESFADFVTLWKHNGFWFFDCPDLIREIAAASALSLDGLALFYYEAYHLDWDEDAWIPMKAEPSFITNVAPAKSPILEGYDVLTIEQGNQPGHSPLSCNGFADEVRTNSHCLLESFEDARDLVEANAFRKGEPGPHRIVAVYSMAWPS